MQPKNIIFYRCRPMICSKYECMLIGLKIDTVISEVQFVDKERNKLHFHFSDKISLTFLVEDFLATMTYFFQISCYEAC